MIDNFHCVIILKNQSEKNIRKNKIYNRQKKSLVWMLLKLYALSQTSLHFTFSPFYNCHTMILKRCQLSDIQISFFFYKVFLRILLFFSFTLTVWMIIYGMRVTFPANHIFHDFFFEEVLFSSIQYKLFVQKWTNECK